MEGRQKRSLKRSCKRSPGVLRESVVLRLGWLGRALEHGCLLGKEHAHVVRVEGDVGRCDASETMHRIAQRVAMKVRYQPFSRASCLMSDGIASDARTAVRNH